MIRLAVALLVVALLAAPLGAEAQPAGKVYRVALILTTSPISDMAGPEPIHPSVRAFVHGLRALGYREGLNLILERRSAEGRFERFADIIREVVRLKVDVIVTVGDSMTQQAKAVTTTIPIVMTLSPDPVGAGLVSSLAHPGGNITGLTAAVDAEIEGKRLELLKETLPRISRVAYLGLKGTWDSGFGESVRAASRVLGLALVLAEHTPNDFTSAFRRIERDRPDALFVGPHPSGWVHRKLIVDFATRSRLPSIHSQREPVELGGLMSYGANAPDQLRRAADYVDRILQGAKPAHLPVERPTKFDLIINLKTAKALGLTIPQSVLARADEVIQ